MARILRPVVAGLAATGLLLGPVPAMADDAPGTAPDHELVTAVIEDLPVPATDVTTTDGNLRTTSNEVAVISDDGQGSPTVVKLRAETPAEAEELARKLDRRPGVVAVPNARVRAFGLLQSEPLGSQQWNMGMVGAPTAWATAKGAGVKVAVIDTGVDATHPDLAGRVLPEIDLIPDAEPGPDLLGHGTRVATLIAGGLTGVGMAGVAPQATILPVAALDPIGYGDTSTVARAIIAAADAGARVINMSLGGPDRDAVLDRACAYAHSKGATLVAAVGNSYEDGNEVQYPAASPHVLGVASVDSTGTPSEFSNTGSYVDLAAPGQSILAGMPGGGFSVETGTSFAAPHVSGVLALMASANPALTATDLTTFVQLTAKDDVSADGRDDQIGFGIVRADRAVAAAKAAKTAPKRSARLRLLRVNASPEPLRRGRVATVAVKVLVRYPDGSWRANPMPATVRFEFKSTKSSRYRVVGLVGSRPGGWAKILATPKSSGKWRAKVLQSDGTWSVSKVDRLKVRR
ncbi:MAG: S8 family serine peptidase [Candidatus Nanopelagicales bacterium]